MKIEEITIGKRRIAFDTEPYIIAEIGNNHDRKKSQAIEMIQAAAKAGADAVKFQTYKADQLVTPQHELYPFFSEFELPYEWHAELQSCAHEEGVDFISTPFDTDSLAFLLELGVPALKIASSDLTNGPLVRAAAESGLPLMISTGMASMLEIGNMLELVHMSGNQQVVIMQCESRYPAPVESANISLLCEFQRLFSTVVGFSDHSLSVHLPVAATALCARVIEKHFTLSRDLDGPDHAVALEPDEFASMALGCRNTVQALGNRQKEVTKEIEKVRQASLRGLYAARDLKAGEVLETKMLMALRPASECTVDRIDALLGRPLKRDVAKGVAIKRQDVK